MGENEAWLSLTKEDPIEPDLPIIDAHHHLWKIPANRNIYNFGSPHYLVKEFIQDASGGHNIVETVFMDSNVIKYKNLAGETEYINRITAHYQKQSKIKIAAAIIAGIDLTLGDAVSSVIEAQMEASNRFRGVRSHFQWDPLGVHGSAHLSFGVTNSVNRGDLLSDPKLREGAACLKKYGLSLDISNFHTQLRKTADLARSIPETPVVINHIGTPLGIWPYVGKHEEVYRDWKRGIIELSTCDNVFMKLGGFGMPMFGFDWHLRPKPPTSTDIAKIIGPYVNTCIEIFGDERCMFYTNFPVDKISYSYTIIWNAYKRITKDYSSSERANLFLLTAAKVYRLSINNGIKEG